MIMCIFRRDTIDRMLDGTEEVVQKLEWLVD